eukprot:m.1114893 g.1114893  ORF g.1114893 m.1114893 type:complete len:502 (-) comp24368_c0_seq28:3753-5258(-)
MSTPIELFRSARAAITATRALGAFVSETDHKTALKAAQAAAHRLSNGNSLGDLDGRTLAVKDNFCVSGSLTTCASKALATFEPCYTATAVKRLQDAGCVVVGKTNLDEFGMGSFNLHSIAGHVSNPYPISSGIHDATSPRVSGGSSGGSAVAVASFSCDIALGSDTGGSVRIPAAYCGVVGYKPSYGRTSRHGLVAYASSLDTPGILSRSVRMATVAANAMSGPDVNDATSTLGSTSFVPEIGGDLTGVTVGIPRQYHIAELAPAMLAAWQQAEAWVVARGATVVPVDLHCTRNGLPAYYLLAAAEASSNMARYDGMQYGQRSGAANSHATVRELITASRSDTLGAEVQRRILTGCFTLARDTYDSYYDQAQRVRRLICDDFARVLVSDASVPDGTTQRVDALLTPTTPTIAPTVAAARAYSAVQGYANDVFTVPASLAGLPAISVPIGYIDSATDTYVGATGPPATAIPAGMQIIAARGNEQRVLQVAQVLEEAAADTRT